MRRISIFLVLMALTVAIALPAATDEGKKPWTPDDLWKLKRVGDNQVSPDGKWIAYVVSVTDFEENNRNSDIWIIPAGGGEGRRMTTSPKSDNHPRWSPDGKTIAFLSSRDDSRQIYILPLQGGEARKATDIYGGVGDFIWTHDGAGFIFTARIYPGCEDFDCVKERDEEKEKCKVTAMVHKSLMYRHWDTYEDGKVQHLFHIATEDGEPRDLTPELKFDALTYWLGSAGREFDLSPDGKTIYFAGKQDEDQAVSYNEEIWMVSIEGGEAKKLTSNPAADSHPRISPDGKYIAYRATRRPGYESDRYELTVIKLPDGEPVSLTPDFALLVTRWYEDLLQRRGPGRYKSLQRSGQRRENRDGDRRQGRRGARLSSQCPAGPEGQILHLPLQADGALLRDIPLQRKGWWGEEAHRRQR